MKDYRDYLRAKGIQPVTIERTVKAPGSVVLHSWALPIERVPLTEAKAA